MLDKLFGSKLRAKLLSWLFLHSDQRYFVRQLKTLLRQDAANISRELARLADMGFLTCQVEGRQKYYQANAASPFFNELRGLFVKTDGLAGILREALKPLSKKIKVAFIYGSFAASSAKANSDVDLMVVGSCDFGEVVTALARVQEELGREVNPSVYDVDEFSRKAGSGSHFVKSVLTGRKIFLIGDENELKGLA